MTEPVRFYTFEEWIRAHPELLKKPENCTNCSNSKKEKCEDCDGRGRCSECGRGCETCGGARKVPCYYCSGEGLRKEAKATYQRIRQREEGLLKTVQKVKP